jgi:hypothetical protein
MIKKITNYLQYKKRLKLLKQIGVAKLSDLVINKSDYINGFGKLLLTLSHTDDAKELQKSVDEFLTILKSTTIANNSLKKINK